MTALDRELALASRCDPVTRLHDSATGSSRAVTGFHTAGMVDREDIRTGLGRAVARTGMVYQCTRWWNFPQVPNCRQLEYC